MSQNISLFEEVLNWPLLFVVHVPQNISKTCSMFLKVPNTSIEVQVVGKRLTLIWVDFFGGPFWGGGGGWG